MALAILVFAGLLAIPAAAQAATLPSPQFPIVQLSPGLNYPPQLISQPDGGVMVGGCGTLGGNYQGFAQYSAAGKLVQASVLTVNGRTLYVCVNQSAVGADGTVYTDAYDPTSRKEVLVAFKGGAQKWFYTPPCDSISALALGSNGNVYMLSQSCPNGRTRLVGVKAATPTVVANTEIARQVVPSGGLSPYSGGIVVKFYDGIGFYSYTGQQNTGAAGWNIPSLGFVGDGGQPFTTESGVAMVPILGSSGLPLLCQGDRDISSSINAYTPGGLLWSHSLPACSRVLAIRPMYNGGAIALLEVKDLLSLDYQRKLYAISPNNASSPLWSAPLLKTVGDTAFGNLAFSGDMNGNVVVQQQFTRRENGYDYPGVLVSLISGFTGANISALEIAGDAAQGYGYCVPGGGTAIPTIAKDVIYLALAHGIVGCDYNTTSLYAFGLPGATLDYPRGAIYTSTAPWKNYVALGDSFSSLEGNPPFEPGTDTSTNACHRSLQAYANQLSGNPALRWKLTSFVACSGATTSDVLSSRRYNEEPQVNRLNTTTDVVTISIGGNDIGFKDFVLACLFDDCASQGVNKPFFDAVANSLAGKAPTRSSPYGSGLLGVYSTIKSKAPKATVYVLGYPQLLPSGGCAQTDNFMKIMNDVVSKAHNGDPISQLFVRAIGKFGGISDTAVDKLIASGTVKFSTAEATAARTLVQKLNDKIRQTTAAMGGRFKYVDPVQSGSPFLGNELCTGHEHFNGLVVNPFNPPQFDTAYSFHPNNLGSDDYRKLLAALNP